MPGQCVHWLIAVTFLCLFYLLLLSSLSPPSRATAIPSSPLPGILFTFLQVVLCPFSPPGLSEVHLSPSGSSWKGWSTLAMLHALWVSVQPQWLKDSWLLLVFLSLTHTVQLKQLLVDSANVPRVGQPLKQVLGNRWELAGGGDSSNPRPR